MDLSSENIIAVMGWVQGGAYAGLSSLALLGICRFVFGLSRIYHGGKEKLYHSLEQSINFMTSASPATNHYPPFMFRDSLQEAFDLNFERYYLQPISAWANLMPPIGFLGTVAGMIGIFSTGAEGEAFKAGLGTALYTTFWSLLSFAILEGMRNCLGFLARRSMARTCKDADARLATGGSP